MRIIIPLHIMKYGTGPQNKAKQTLHTSSRAKNITDRTLRFTPIRCRSCFKPIKGTRVAMKPTALPMPNVELLSASPARQYTKLLNRPARITAIAMRNTFVFILQVELGVEQG